MFWLPVTGEVVKVFVWNFHLLFCCWPFDADQVYIEYGLLSVWIRNCIYRRQISAKNHSYFKISQKNQKSFFSYSNFSPLVQITISRALLSITEHFKSRFVFMTTRCDIKAQWFLRWGFYCWCNLRNDFCRLFSLRQLCH